MDKKEFIARRTAKEFKDGYYVNLGIGLPTLIPSLLPGKIRVTLHTENGMLGYGGQPWGGGEDAGLVNAGNEKVTAMPGGA